MGIFDRKNKTRFSADTTIISSNAKLKGDIHIDGNLNIYGVLNGDILSKGIVVIGEGSNVKGNVKANKLYISGSIEGDVDSQIVEILPKGILKGNITTNNLSIDNGGIFEGSSLGNFSKGEKGKSSVKAADASKGS